MRPSIGAMATLQRIGLVFGVILGLTPPAAAQQPAATPQQPPSVSLEEGIRDGMRILAGRVVPEPGGDGQTKRVRVTVKRSALSNELMRQNYIQQKSTDEFTADGGFSVTLERPVLAGQVVVAEAIGDDGSPIPNSGSEIVEVIDPGSWGRARAYFSGGVVFSKERDDFSKQDLAVSFAIDKTWLQAVDFELPAPKAVRDTAVASSDRTAKAKAKGKFRPRQLNSFFDARLTALPVQVEGNGSDVATKDQFVDSRKGALLQVGIYAPIYGPQTSWEHDGAIHALFIAPVVRGGVATIAGDDAADATGPSDPDDVNQFWSVGIGVGLHRLTGTANQAPQLINYLHATWGQSEAFELIKDGVVTRPLRWFVEGRLMVPNTALQIGFDANLGDGHDDIRFIFGTRFDIGELIERLSSFQD